MSRFKSLLAATILGLSLMGCAARGGIENEVLREAPRDINSVPTHPYGVECAAYARLHSDIKIFGDASTWWNQAVGKYMRGATPASGAVMVLYAYASSDHGHVAIVRRVVSSREIRVDHANWLNDGSIYLNDPVQDVSDANDWSAIRVWNIKTGGWGAKIYPVQGFLETDRDSVPPDLARKAFGDDQGDIFNPPAESGFALTQEDKAIPSALLFDNSNHSLSSK